MATALRHLLPIPQNPIIPFESPAESAPLYPNRDRITELNKLIPSYGQRQGWVPRKIEDFGDGGAFPEIHVAQYPLDLGRKGNNSSNQSSAIVTLTTDQNGNANYDSVIRQGHRKDVILYSKPGDLKEKSFGEDELARPDPATEADVAEKTKQALEAKLAKKLAATQPQGTQGDAPKPKYIRYTPANQNPAFNSGASHRIIRMVEMPKDPLEPPKFKHTKAPRPPGSPPVPVMHSPPRKLTKEERDAWRIPPCISNWKNNKGYVIPLDKRLAADGRGLHEVGINNTFAHLSQALYIAERNAREEVQKRLAIKQELEKQRQQEREEELRKVAQQVRMQRSSIQTQATVNETDEEREARIEREKLREERRRDREREHRLDNRGSKKKSKMSRDGQRDISEKIALGEASLGPRAMDSVYDQRLFNQTQGLDSGFGDEEDYNVYDKRLFGGEREQALYKAPKAEDVEQYGGASLDDIVNTKKFKPNKDFSGVDRNHNDEREGPVQYEKEMDNTDKWGIDDFMKQVKSGKKTEEKESTRQKLGVMHAAGGGSGSVEDYRGGKDRKINFQPSQEEESKKIERRDERKERETERKDSRDNRSRDDRTDRGSNRPRGDRRDDRSRDDRRDRYERRDDRRRGYDSDEGNRKRKQDRGSDDESRKRQKR